MSTKALVRRFTVERAEADPLVVERYEPVSWTVAPRSLIIIHSDYRTFADDMTLVGASLESCGTVTTNASWALRRPDGRLSYAQFDQRKRLTHLMECTKDYTDPDNWK